MRSVLLFIFSVSFLFSCSSSRKAGKSGGVDYGERTKTFSANSKAKTFTKPLPIDRSDFVSYAKTLLGTPYKYGSAVPKNGLDCSGFVTCVFGHFKVKPPRSSVDFTNEGMTIDLKNAKPGDLILFTGSDNSSGVVGHMGIVTAAGNPAQFIHSASGKSIGVMYNTVTGYYKTHFVKVIRVLE